MRCMSIRAPTILSQSASRRSSPSTTTSSTATAVRWGRPPPSPSPGSTTPRFLQSASDPDNSDVLHVDPASLTGLAAGVTLVGDALHVDPNAYNSLAVGEQAIIAVNYNVIDGHGGTVGQTATITVTGVNDAP